MNKAIDKSTVSNYATVSENLNPWIEKYEEAIKVLQLLNQNPIKKYRWFKDGMEPAINGQWVLLKELKKENKINFLVLSDELEIKKQKEGKGEEIPDHNSRKGEYE